MLTIGAFEAKNTLGSLLDRVQTGEEIIISRHGKAVARLVPNVGGIDRAQARAAMARMRARVSTLSAKLGSGGLDWETLKADRDEGRP